MRDCVYKLIFTGAFQPWTKAYFVFLSIFPLIPVLPPLLSISHSRFPLSQCVSVPPSLSLDPSLLLCVRICECNAMWLGWRWADPGFPGCALDSGLLLEAEGRKVRSGQGRVGLAACSLGVLMLLADPCAQREPDRRACLIHESPAEVLWGFWLHCPFSAERRGPPPSSEEELSNVVKWASTSLPRGKRRSHFTVASKDRKFNPA